MTHTIELSPRAERRLKDKARRAGLSLDKYLSRIAEREAEELEPVEMQAGVLSDEDKSDIAARLYEQSLREGGDLTAFSQAQEDLHEYSADEMAAMEAGAYERPLR